VWVLLEDVLEALLDESHCGMRGCDATLKTTIEGIKSVVEVKKESAKIGGQQRECFGCCRMMKPLSWLLKLSSRSEDAWSASASERGAEKWRQSSLPFYV
jgi:hypothetical protein